ncbi:hypothetical protein IJT17_03455 [bacterium]|nr:hypothetical protein [bacterium]
MKLTVGINKQQKRAHEELRVAQEPAERYCYIKEKKVQILIIYPEYRNPYDKGKPGDICCANIIECYSEHVKCRYSGISPLYPDPFVSPNN